jgi:thiosulfate reductase cytochrome b subunit
MTFKLGHHPQRLAYTGMTLMGAGSLLTGLAIYKPTQLHVITALLGVNEMARWFHLLADDRLCWVLSDAGRTGHSSTLEQLQSHDYRV